MLPNFIAKTTIDTASCLRVRGQLALEAHQALRDTLVGSLGRDVASLFAEPILTPKDGQIEVAWYAEQVGEPVAFDALDPEAHRVVADKLRSRLRAIQPLLDDAVGPLLRCALYISDSRDILAIGQEPVLIRWGVVSHGVDATNQASLNGHFAQTLGPYAPFSAPRLADGPVAEPKTMPSPVLPPAETTPVRIATLANGRQPDGSMQGVLIATAIAAAIALILALPGVLSRASDVSDGQDAGLALARQISAGMQDKVAKARAAVDAANCNQDGTVGTLPTNGAKQAELPPPPVPIRPDQAGGGLALVAQRATEAVVFILTCTDKPTWQQAHKDDKEKSDPVACPGQSLLSPSNAASKDQADLVFSAAGSGFFIAPKLIATNTHVVEDAKAVFVTSRFLGSLTQATVKAATIKQKTSDPDFAVVEIQTDHSPQPIALTPSVSRLQNVVAAGFPGVIIQEDAQLKRLLQGDMNSAPELTTFPGFVTLTMDPDSGLPLIFSSAVIGHGNSGGPLLDLCARAVGVNTLGWSGDEGDTGYKVNVAEGAKGLASFLDAKHIDYQKADGACQPDVQANNGSKPPEAPTGTPPAAAPDPSPPPVSVKGK